MPLVSHRITVVASVKRRRPGTAGRRYRACTFAGRVQGGTSFFLRFRELFCLARRSKRTSVQTKAHSSRLSSAARTPRNAPPSACIRGTLAHKPTPSRGTCKEPNKPANTATQIDTSHALRLARQAFHCLTHCAPHCTSLHANELAGRRTDGLAHDATACAQTAGTRRMKPRRIRHVRQRACSCQIPMPYSALNASGCPAACMASRFSPFLTSRRRLPTCGSRSVGWSGAQDLTQGTAAAVLFLQSQRRSLSFHSY